MVSNLLQVSDSNHVGDVTHCLNQDAFGQCTDIHHIISLCVGGALSHRDYGVRFFERFLLFEVSVFQNMLAYGIASVLVFMLVRRSLAKEGVPSVLICPPVTRAHGFQNCSEIARECQTARVTRDTPGHSGHSRTPKDTQDT